jgi:transketolase
MLGRLYQLHLKTRDSGIRDFEAAAVIAGLLHRGDVAQARATYDYYMSVRRSRIRCHPTLQFVQDTLRG